MQDNNFNQTMYDHFIELYQERYISKMPVITWKHISYWRKMANHYALLLIDAGLLSIEKHICNKQELLLPVGFTTENILQLQQNILDEN